MILARILDPRSKLATARSLRNETLTHTLGEKLGIEDAGDNELYRAMDWLLRRQDRSSVRSQACHRGGVQIRRYARGQQAVMQCCPGSKRGRVGGVEGRRAGSGAHARFRGRPLDSPGGRGRVKPARRPLRPHREEYTPGFVPVPQLILIASIQLSEDQASPLRLLQTLD